MAKLTDLAKLFEQMARLYVKAANLVYEMDIDPMLHTKEEKEKKIPASVREVWDKYCEARAHHFRTKHNLSSTHKVVHPALTPHRAKLISDAVKRHGVERVKRAVIGLFLDPWMAGKNEHGQEYLEVERAVSIKNKDGMKLDAVDRFCDVYRSVHGEL